MARSALSFVFVWLTLLSAARASAEAAPRVVLLEIADCPDGALRLADAYQAARLELEQDGVTSVQAESDAVQAQAELTASLRCGPGVEATLRFRLRDGTSSASRVISLNDANPKDCPRLLGLALAELVRSDWAGLAEPGAAVAAAGAKSADESRPVAAPAAAAAATPKPPSVPRHDESIEKGQQADAESGSPRLAFSADVIARWFTVHPGLTFGAAFGVERGWLSVGVEGALGRNVTERGTADYGFGAATLGASVLRAASSAGRLALGPKLALGGTWATGESSRADVVTHGKGGLYADARVEAAGAVRLSAVELGARLSGGLARGLSLTDESRLIGATGGWFLGAALGVRW